MPNTTRTRTSPTSYLQTTNFMSAAHVKHTTTTLADLTTAATAHGQQLHSTKTLIISNTTSKRGRSNTAAVQGISIEILPPEGKIKYSGQHIIFKNALHVEFELHQVRVGNIHEPQAGVDVTKIPTEGKTHTLRRHSDPSSTHQERDDDGSNSTTDDEDHQTNKERQAGTSCAAAQAASASVDVTSDAERHNTHSEEGNTQVDDLLAASRIMSWILNERTTHDL